MYEFEDGTFTLCDDCIVISDASMFYECNLKYDNMDGELIVSESTVEMRIAFEYQTIYERIYEGTILLFYGMAVFNNTPIDCTLPNMRINTILTNTRVNNRYWQVIFNVDIPGIFDVCMFFF